MKALLLNSGIGKRMGNFTKNACKCMVDLGEGITIISNQLTLLSKLGVKDVCITTGPFADQLEQYVCTKFPDMNFVFVHNPRFSETNYIYSIYLAREVLHDDIIMMHGDLVFEETVLSQILGSPRSVVAVDSGIPLPEKDFKACTLGDRVAKIGVNFFENSVASQPLYQLKQSDWEIWLQEIIRFCEAGQTNVYAEEAFNAISSSMQLYPLDIVGHLCREIDNPEDLKEVQKIYWKKENGGS